LIHTEGDHQAKTGVTAWYFQKSGKYACNGKLKMDNESVYVARVRSEWQLIRKVSTAG
jgi:hypothetical protein